MPIYKKAFKCHECPEKNGEEGCPAWNEIIMTNIQSGEDKIVKGCFDILQDALPIDIHAHGGMTKEAASKVADMVNAMSNKNDSGVTH